MEGADTNTVSCWKEHDGPLGWRNSHTIRNIVTFDYIPPRNLTYIPNMAIFTRSHLFQTIDDARESTVSNPCNFGGARYHKAFQANRSTIVSIILRYPC